MPSTKSLGISRKRGQLPASTSGLGLHFTSPKGRRAPKRKTQKLASSALDFHSKKRRLEAELAALMEPVPELDDFTTRDGVGTALETSTADLTAREFQNADMATTFDPPLDDMMLDPSTSSTPPPLDDWPTEPKPKHLNPDQAALNLLEKWGALLPSLAHDLLAYYAASAGQPIRTVGQILAETCPFCSCHDSERKSTKILALYFDHFISTNVTHCPCRTTPQVLLKAGLFPTVPSQVRMAISVDFLDFYSALFEHSCNAINTMAAALNTFYSRRGFYLLNKKDEKFREPFRRELGYAAQWLDMLHVSIERSVDEALEEADSAIHETNQSTPPGVSPDPVLSMLLDDIDYKKLPQRPRPLDECSRALRQLCPACFGSNKLGRPFEEGGDFQICTDGNFHHRHLISGGQGIPFHTPRHIIPKSFVDEVGERIDQKCRIAFQ